MRILGETVDLGRAIPTVPMASDTTAEVGKEYVKFGQALLTRALIPTRRISMPIPSGTRLPDSGTPVTV